MLKCAYIGNYYFTNIDNCYRRVMILMLRLVSRIGLVKSIDDQLYVDSVCGRLLRKSSASEEEAHEWTFLQR